MKGITQNVIPFSSGWAVFEDHQPDTLRFFECQDMAIAFAQERACYTETAILIHNMPLQEADCQQVLMMPAGEA